MHRYLKALIFIALAAALSSSFCVSAAGVSEQSIKFAAYCETTQEIAEAVESGAEFVCFGSTLTALEAYEATQGKVALIADAESIEQAEKIYSEISMLSIKNVNVYYRISVSAGKATEWAQSKGVKLIGYYKGNIFPIAVSAISKYAKFADGAIIQMQTNNQDGVILHNSVTSGFTKHGAIGMFSFVDSTRSAKRTDSARSWDDLISRGYTLIETAYPADFAEYLKNNTAERQKLEASVNTALATSTQGCPPNRVKTYQSALEDASDLLSDGSSATYAMADARTALDEAVKNIKIPDGSKIQGDLKFTPGRIAWALFGIALVLSWQIFFRKRWAKN
ncbi:MAG: hypothetical protein IJA87_04060 [Clostridia bacterium]|nr:hypothetical protein [Clostridia bacterium]